MPGKYINNGIYASSGYTLSGVFQAITIGPTGTIGGPGLIGGTKEAYTIVNRGRVSGTYDGIYLHDGGNITNGARGGIAGYDGVHVTGAKGLVTNDGTIAASGTKGIGVLLADGGSVTNATTAALIRGTYGVDVQGGAGTVTNAGIVKATGSAATSGRYGPIGIYFAGDAGISTLTNVAGAVVEGNEGVQSCTGATLSVGNAGQIEGTGSYGIGLNFRHSGTLFNTGTISGTEVGVAYTAPATNTGPPFQQMSITNSGLIVGPAFGVVSSGFVLLSNSGTIQSGDYARIRGNSIATCAGVNFEGAAIITNAGSLASITGANGIFSRSVSVATVTNSGLIAGFGGATNAAVGSTQSGSGVYLNVFLNSGSEYNRFVLVTNNVGGTIQATTSLGIGVELAGAGGGRVTNAGTIDGGTGVLISSSGSSTITNSGTIESTSGAKGVAVEFTDATTDLLIDEAHSTFIGQVLGGGGTLELAGAGGSISGLGTSFSGFGTIDVLAGAGWSLGGANTLAAGTTLTVESGGTLDDSGVITGAGALILDGTIAVASGKNLTLTGPASFAGGIFAGPGALITKGTTALSALTLTGGATWNDGGTVAASGSLTLGGPGGASGKIGILKGATFDLTGSGGITIAAGGKGSTINDGLLEKTTGMGRSRVVGALDNAGTLAVTSGTLDIAGVVSGSGAATIGAAGTLEFDSTVAASVTISFAGTTGGRLLLDDPSGTGLGFAGAISGFGGSDTLDLASFADSGKPSLSWSQDGSSGTLTVTDGSDVAKITLFGQYAAAGFKAAKDGGTGTLITYTAPTQTVALASPPR